MEVTFDTDLSPIKPMYIYTNFIFKNDFFELWADRKLEHIHRCCDWGYFFYIYKGARILLCHQGPYDTFEDLSNLLKKCLTGDHYLQQNSQNIGFSYNEYKEDSRRDETIKKDWEPFYNHLFTTTNFSASIECASWLYNNEKGEIVFEITPLYKWHNRDPYSIEHYYSYEEFKKDYTPIAQIIISKQDAEQLLIQAEAFMKIFSDNWERALAED